MNLLRLVGLLFLATRIADWVSMRNGVASCDLSAVPKFLSVKTNQPPSTFGLGVAIPSAPLSMFLLSSPLTSAFIASLNFSDFALSSVGSITLAMRTSTFGVSMTGGSLWDVVSFVERLTRFSGILEIIDRSPSSTSPCGAVSSQICSSRGSI